MAEIIRITIKGESGYCPVDEAYFDKLTIDRDSIRYEYKPEVESEINPQRKWSYKSSSPIFQKLFREVAAAVGDILNWDEEPYVTDLGVTSFTVIYADKTKTTRNFILSGSDLSHTARRRAGRTGSEAFRQAVRRRFLQKKHPPALRERA